MNILSAGLKSVPTDGIFYDSCPAEVASGSREAVLSVLSSPPEVCDHCLVVGIMSSFFRAHRTLRSVVLLHYVHMVSVSFGPCLLHVQYKRGCGVGGMTA